MNIVILIVSALATAIFCLALCKLCGCDLWFKSEAEYDADSDSVSVNHVRTVYRIIDDERYGYLYKKGDCPQDLRSQYYNLREHFNNHEYYNIKAEKLLQLGSSFTVDELNKQRNELGKQYVPSPDYTDKKNLELLDKLYELYKARERLMDRASDIEEHTIHVTYV